ncbi:hypothetical protein CRU98_10090 [Arcobacter sp. CECT 8986]|uniref:hypothetical protein n=1 Tax=Arcobacter sp. CECT 8986 TaxID=2044507 RepID=UPI001009B54C|nr:hypothetical protein [Arcobacter sp. CECT 8986]RXJ98379.1 hypothetical protein CRU98_10090 [Arcobacter sp. CECT 8986]
MSRFANIPKDDIFLKRLLFAIESNDKEFKFTRGTTRKDISFKLGFNSVKEFNSYVDFSSTKYFRIDEIFIIIDCLSSNSQKIVFDYICSKYDFLCFDSALSNNLDISLESILLHITSTNGELSKHFLEAVKDNNIDENEKQKLNSIAYQFRSLLRTFEAKIKGFDND